jgi:hypothetical protein
MGSCKAKLVKGEALGLASGELLDLIWEHWQWPPRDGIGCCWVWGGAHNHLTPVAYVAPRLAVDVRRELYRLEFGSAPSRISMTCGTFSCVRPHHASQA